MLWRTISSNVDNLRFYPPGELVRIKLLVRLAHDCLLPWYGDMLKMQSSAKRTQGTDRPATSAKRPSHDLHRPHHVHGDHRHHRGHGLAVVGPRIPLGGLAGPSGGEVSHDGLSSHLSSHPAPSAPPAS